MRISALPRQLWLLALRLIPRAFHTRGSSAALRVARLDAADRAELARNLRAMLRPKAAA